MTDTTPAARTDRADRSPFRRPARRWAVVTAAIAAAAGLPSAAAVAAPIVWDGDGPDAAFSTGGNWVGDVAPQNSATADTAVFDGTPTIAQPVLTANQSVLGIDFRSAGWSVLPPSVPASPPPPVTTLTLGAGGITSAGTGTNTIAVNVTQSVAATWAIGAGNTLVLNSPTVTTTAQPTIAGAGSFVKSGASTLSLGNANTYAGVTTVRQGVLNVNAAVAEGANGPLGNATSAVVLGDASTPVAGGGSTTNVTLQVNGAGAATFGRDVDATQAGGTVTGRTRFAAAGGGPATVTMTGDIAFRSVGNVGGRRFELGAADGKTFVLAGLMSSTADTNIALLYNGNNYGGGTFRVTNPANTYAGGSTVIKGTLSIAGGVPATGNSPIGTGGLTLGEGATPVVNFTAAADKTAVVQFQQEAPGATFARLITISTGATFDPDGSGPTGGPLPAGNGVVNAYVVGGANATGTVTFAGNINSHNDADGDVNLTFRATTGGTVAFTGVLNDNADAARQTFVNVNQVVNLDQTDFAGPGTTNGAVSGGTVVLTGANTYQGGTFVRGGTLLANNAAGSAAGTGPVTILSGATFGGTGAVTGAVAAQAGSTVSPGGAGAAGVESLSTGAVAMAGGSTLAAEINTSLLVADLLAVTGDLTLDPAAAPALAVTDLGTGAVVPQGTAFTLATYTGTYNGGLFAVGGNPIDDDVESFTVGVNTFALDYNRNGNSVALVAVPEPATAGLLAAGAGLLLAARRRREVAAR